MSQLMSQVQADRLMDDARRRTVASETLLKEFRLFSRIVLFLLGGTWFAVMMMLVTGVN